MNPFTITLVAAALICSAPVRLHAGMKTDGKGVPARSADGAADLVTSLEIAPEKIVISGKFETIQVIVMARLASGDRMDVTGLATFKVGGGVAEVSPEGEVRPLRSGNGTLHVELAGHTTQVPIEIMRIPSRAPADFI